MPYTKEFKSPGDTFELAVLLVVSTVASPGDEGVIEDDDVADGATEASMGAPNTAPP